ncbi:MAG: acyl-CoA thioesterase [Halobacteriovoraceae bacterium]|nr:acyl-CoA thioesterase [Halobacteriovoraceae bacterium]
MAHEYKVLIKEFHLDFLGHVNNARYFDLFEEARWDLIQHNDWGVERIKKEKKSPVVLDAEIIFKKEILLREEINIVTTWLGMKNRLVFELEQIMYKPNGDLACKSIFRVGFMDLNERKLIVPADDFLAAVQ